MRTSRVPWAGTVPVPPVAEQRGFFILAPRGRTCAVLATFGLLLACGGPAVEARAATSAVADDRGRTVAAAVPAARIISTVPSVTDLILALGAADRLIVRTAYDTDPALAHLPSLGRTLSPTVESLIPHGPDLVITPADRYLGGVARLDVLDVPVYAADVRRIADIGSTTERLGALLGLPARADSLVRALERGLDSVRAAVAGVDRPTVLYLIWPDPPQSAGPGTYIDELIAIAGGSSAFADVSARWPVLSLEEIVRRDPDFVVLPEHAAPAPPMPRVDGAPGWRDLSAFREGRVVRLEANLFDRPGARVVEAARTLAGALHPDARLR